MIFSQKTTIILLLALQLIFIFIIFQSFAVHYAYLHIVFSTVAIVLAIYILNSSENPAYKLAWIVPLVIVPIFTVVLYILLKNQFSTRKVRNLYAKKSANTRPFLKTNEQIMSYLHESEPDFYKLANYVDKSGGYPVCGNTEVTYFPLGEDKYKAMLEELQKAQEFIFMEYFIVERGYMWDSILEILEEKVKEGVEVRVMYDGMCCLMLLPYRYPKVLEGKGIRCKMFSPIKPTLSTYQNNRDHRKIVVIDGQTAFTGGVNLAGEYINRKVRFGHWKDTAVMLKGDAVNSFTMMFLQMWNVTEREQDDFGRYVLPRGAAETGEGETGGFVLPYGDSPMDREQVGERVYLDILNQAKNYVHIMTPYLILDDEMENALCYAAKRGIDVAIIMPHIPDKKYAYLLARTYYPELIEAGVKIYEYTPGFVHAKVFVSDDEKAVVGTINLDFRSLYLHFECAAYIYRNPVVLDVEKDYQDTLMKCSRITMEDCRDYSWGGRKLGRLMRLVAPLM